MLPNVTQSFKLRRPDLENCSAEAGAQPEISMGGKQHPSLNIEIFNVHCL